MFYAGLLIGVVSGFIIKHLLIKPQIRENQEDIARLKDQIKDILWQKHKMN